MKLLLKNSNLINVFTNEIEKADVYIVDGKIMGVGDYGDFECENVVDIGGKYLCPGFIDGHIHIESSMLTPYELAKACLPHGTTSIVADPHEIANVCGDAGIDYILESSRGLPMNVYITLPSCVPATKFDHSKANLGAELLHKYYADTRVVGLGEVMDYPGVISGTKHLLDKIEDAEREGKNIDGHAPLLCGRALDKYISEGIRTEHECSSFKEGAERIRKGQWVMIREGTAAKNLCDLIDLFDMPYATRCILATDDRHPLDLIEEGHIDNIIRGAVKAGKSAITAIRMATLQAAECFNLRNVGAVAPGYRADLVVFDDLEKIIVRDVYSAGRLVVKDGEVQAFEKPSVSDRCESAVHNTFSMPKVRKEDFLIEPRGERCRVIELIPHQLITREYITEINFKKSNGIDTGRDIIKIAIAERHNNTGIKTVGFIKGTGIYKGAMASSVSHDSHNIVVMGACEEDMAHAVNLIAECGGGLAVVKGGRTVGMMPLPVGGVVSEKSCIEAAEDNRRVREAVNRIRHGNDEDLFMTMAFLSLAVIPDIKITTSGIVDVNLQKTVDLFVD